eukprot:TRINITY_DN26581_c0_g1_i1.p1 TRINITY_DN26581_c0_g1~~TRINITY_DN26581_c0_g1_i1.p1  ORF type:complete len:447 (+),score=78.97 TRINITY_DN26581_c0_g1_i1:37-1377(+)
MVRRPGGALGSLLAAAVLPGVPGLKLQGELPAATEFAEFTGKFCYDYTAAKDERSGVFGVEVTWDGPDPDPTKEYWPLHIVLFDDERGRWSEAEKTWDTSTCEEKLSTATYVLDIDLTSTPKRSHHEVRVSQHIRPRFWYFSFVACGIPPGMKINYKMHLQNPGWGWQKEFSFDRLGTLPYLFVCTFAFVIAAALTVWATCWKAVAWDQRWRDHPYVRMLLALCFASVGACALFLVHYSSFAQDGRGYSSFEVAGIVLVAVANCMMFVIAALAAMGWAISDQDKDMQFRWQLIAGVIALGVAGALCELRGEFAVDKSTKLFAQTSLAGLLVIILKGLLFAWVYYRMRCSLNEEWQTRQRNFYKAFSVSFAFWSLTVPLIAILAMLLDPWVRYKVVTGADFAARWLGLVLLGVLFGGPLSPIFQDTLLTNKDVDPSTVGLQMGLADA